jgi:multiple sugar transport system permease protein
MSTLSVSATQRRRGLTDVLETRSFPLLLILPASALILAVLGFPFVYTLWLSLQSWRIAGATTVIQFVGSANYQRLFGDALYWQSFLHTLAYIALAVTCEFLTGLGIALVLQRQFRGAGFLRSVIMVPLFIVPVIVALIWRIVYNQEYGPLYYTLQAVGLASGKGAWGLSDPNMAMVFIVAASVWQIMPFVFLVFVAGLQGIPRELYEASRMDGASTWQEFRYVTLPGLKSLILFILLFRVMESFKVFDLVIMLTGGGPGSATEAGSATEVTSMYIYRQAFQYFDMGYASALALVLMAVVLILSLALVNVMRIERNV